MSNPEEKATTSTVAEPNTLTRLATFKTPRDLSLGGVKLKKVYTPNLNVTRNKNRGASLNGTRDVKKDDKKKDRKSEKVKFIRPGQNIIKSGGIFSEGVGSIERFSSRPSYGRDVQSTTTATTLLPAAPAATPVRNKDFSRRISSLNGDGGLPENRVEFIEDFKRVKALDAPITLPMDDGLTQLKRHFTVKKEAMMKTKRLQKGVAETNGPHVLKPEPNADDVAVLLRREEPTLLLFKLPYSLPGRVGAEDETRRKHGPAAATAENSHVDEKQAEETRCHLKQMGEGKIGKIRIHRSGRVTLVLGDNILDVNSSTKTSYYQQLVSVGTDEETKTTSMINLGQMQHKVTVTPQWEPIVKGQLQQAI